MSLWHPDNVKDVAESVGIGNLHDDVAENLARDVEYRIAQVLEQALKLMRHAKRTTMTTGDVALALRLLDVEPLYGYEAARPLRFGEATMGPGQPLYYVEDEEVDFEKLINAPLPRIPREMSFTGMFFFSFFLSFLLLSCLLLTLRAQHTGWRSRACNRQSRRTQLVAKRVAAKPASEEREWERRLTRRWQR